MQSDQNLDLIIISNISITNVCQVSKCYSNALKRFFCRKRYNEEFKLIAYNEIYINEQLNFPGVVEYFGYFVDKKDRSVNLLFEFCEGGSLLDFLSCGGRINGRKKLRRFLYKISKAVVDIHNHGIVHNDIKLDNILLYHKGNHIYPKICDFNCAGIISDESQCNCNNKSHDCNYNYQLTQMITLYEEPSFSTDMWSLGSVFFQIIFQRQPFEENFNFFSEASERKYTKTSLYSQLKCKPLKKVIEGLLEINKNTRATGSELLSHPFFRGMKREHIKKNNSDYF